MDNTLFILCLRKRLLYERRKENGETRINVNLEDEATVLHWLVTCAPFWVIIQTCKQLGDYGPPEVLENGTIQYKIHGELHRNGDLPAVIESSGTRFWCTHGRLHREGDLPAIIYDNGSLSWHKHGRLHRDGDLPAYIGADGTQAWWKDGKKHRDGDLPALIITATGYQEWWRYGKQYY